MLDPDNPLSYRKSETYMTGSHLTKMQVFMYK